MVHGGRVRVLLMILRFSVVQKDKDLREKGVGCKEPSLCQAKLKDQEEIHLKIILFVAFVFREWENGSQYYNEAPF